MGWATFWAILLQTHQVTLFVSHLTGCSVFAKGKNTHLRFHFSIHPLSENFPFFLSFLRSQIFVYTCA
jgi:hypothetical protein